MYRHSIHVPLFLNDGTPTPEGTLDLIERELLDHFTGFTAVDGIGAWRNDEGRMYREPVRVYHVDSPEDHWAHQRVMEVADLVAAALQQEAVYVTEHQLVTQLITPVLS